MLETAPFGRRPELSVAISPIKADIHAVTSARYISVCSGIEAATCAWHGLGWEPLAFSEIEPFARALLQHHYPDVPLHGDFTLLRDQDWIVDADILVGGTPCQAFSVAGKRASLADERGSLSLEFVRLADAIDNLRLGAGRPGCTIVWENVFGVLSVSDNAFGCFLGALVGNDTALVPTGGRWTDAGMVVGPQRTAAWRIFDAQYFGLAQRRRRVFVVASPGNGPDPAEVLFEREGVRRHSPPSREKGQRVADSLTVGANQCSGTESDFVEAVAPTLSSRAKGGDGLGTDFDLDGRLVGALTAKKPAAMGAPEVDAGHYIPWPAEIASTLNAAFGDKLGPEDQHALNGAPLFVLGALMEGGNVAVGQREGVLAFDTTQITSRTNRSNPQFGDPCHSLTKAGDPPTVAFEWQRGASQNLEFLNEQSPSLIKSQTPAVATAFSLRGREEGSVPEIHDQGQTASALRAASGCSTRDMVSSPATQVRRLTPRECERLQGFSDDYTLVPFRGKLAADGNRYKALGDSMAVPVMRWIGQRIERLRAQ